MIQQKINENTATSQLFSTTVFQNIRRQKIN